MTVRSPAKINWTLRVLGQRKDGFHEIESLVSAVTLYDELTFADRADSVIELTCDQSKVPADRRNLIVQAAMLLAKDSGGNPGMTCRLTKRIPVGGGLGGGSSNGASALTALSRLWGLDWPMDRLMPLAASLGSDVPFFLSGGSAVVSGRGDRIKPARLRWPGWIVLLLPGIPISSGAVYRAWEPGEDPPGSSVRDALTADDAAGATNAVEWMAGTFNMLEKPVVKVCPVMRGLMARGRELAGRAVRVSGSGSTLFTAFDARAEAERFARRVGDVLGVETRVVQTVDRAGEEI